MRQECPYQLLNPALVFGVKAIDQGTIHIQYTDYFVIDDQGHDNFRVRR